MLEISKIKKLIDNSQIRFEKDFAEMIGLSEQGWFIIKKKATTTNARAKKIAKILNVDVKEILTEKYYEQNWYLFESKIRRSGISNRIKELMEYLNLGITDFSRETYIPKSTISTVLKRDSANIEFILQISMRYKWLNVRWLVTGEGTIRTEMNYQEPEDDYFTQKITQVQEELVKHERNLDFAKKQIDLILRERKNQKT
jgi:transcriptional regulator with XRE-family HTH domain